MTEITSRVKGQRLRTTRRDAATLPPSRLDYGDGALVFVGSAQVDGTEMYLDTANGISVTLFHAWLSALDENYFYFQTVNDHLLKGSDDGCIGVWHECLYGGARTGKLFLIGPIVGDGGLLYGRGAWRFNKVF